MKKFNYFVAAALTGAVAFTSCNVNNTQNNENRAVRFTAGIEQAATPQNASGGTRASGTMWGSDDAIGIFMVESPETLYTNSKYETDGSGSFTAAAGDEMYYPMSGNEVDFIAYYPYESGALLETPINVTIGDQTNQPSFDLLWSSDATGSKSAAATPVALEFKHMLAKIVMNTTAGAGVDEDLTGMTVKIIGMNTKNTFNLSTGALYAPGTVADITPRTVADGSKYDAIIMPDSYDGGAVTVEFTVDDDTFVWTLDDEDASFAGGNEYTYAVKLTRTGVQVTGTISPWTTFGNDRGEVTAE